MHLPVNCEAFLNPGGGLDQLVDWRGRSSTVPSTVVPPPSPPSSSRPWLRLTPPSFTDSLVTAVLTVFTITNGVELPPGPRGLSKTGPPGLITTALVLRGRGLRQSGVRSTMVVVVGLLLGRGLFPSRSPTIASISKSRSSSSSCGGQRYAGRSSWCVWLSRLGT